RARSVVLTLHPSKRLSRGQLIGESSFRSANTFRKLFRSISAAHSMRRSRHLAKPDACEFALPVRAHSHRFSLARTVLGRQRGDKFFETRITAEHIPVGTFLQFAIGNPGWKFDGFLQLFQRQVL